MACPQPSLDDLLHDPLIRMVMTRDGVEPDSLRELLQKVKLGITPARSLGLEARAL